LVCGITSPYPIVVSVMIDQYLRADVREELRAVRYANCTRVRA
jgi:hypothetical protein